MARSNEVVGESGAGPAVLTRFEGRVLSSILLLCDVVRASGVSFRPFALQLPGCCQRCFLSVLLANGTESGAYS